MLAWDVTGMAPRANAVPSRRRATPRELMEAADPIAGVPRPVVVAEDEPHVRNLVAMLVVDLGHEPVAVADGLAALDAVRVHRPRLVVSDVMMPRMDGAELCRRLKADPATAAIPVLLLSAVRPGPDVLALADAYLAKPFDLDEVERTIVRLLGRTEGATAGRQHPQT